MDGQLRTYIRMVRWQHAVTMPEWPHQYTVKSWYPEWSTEFVAFCQHVAERGVRQPWPPPPAVPIYRNLYLVLGDHKYWAMGPHGDLDTPQDMTVINRTPAAG